MTREEIIQNGTKVYQRPKLLKENIMHYCPGCSHGVVHKLVAEVLDEMGLENEAIGIAPVGCAVFAYNYLDVDWVEAAHGRAPALATAISRLRPDKVVFTYQGDGDLAAIGTAETIHACTRGENIVIIMINNGIYGMTGGQMSPCTLEGAKTATTPYGRRHDLNGFPLKVSNVVSLLDGTCYVTRQAVHPRRRAQGQGRSEKSLPECSRQKGHIVRRGGCHLLVGLEDESREIEQMDGRQHVRPLPAGRHQGYVERRRRASEITPNKIHS